MRAAGQRLAVAAGDGPKEFPYLRAKYRDWWIPWVGFDAGAVGSGWVAIITARDLDANSNPIGPEHRFCVVGVDAAGGLQRFGDLSGPYGDQANPKRSGSIGRVELGLYLSRSAHDSGERVATLVVEVAVGGAVPD